MNKNDLTCHFKNSGLKLTGQRRLIIEVLLKNNKKHLSLEQLLEEAKKISPDISAATVYRNVAFLEKSAIITKMKLPDNRSYYQVENRDKNSGHHDHLLCESCGRIIEFFNEEIENLQKKISESYGFVMSGHRMEIYGLCRQCKGKIK